VSATFGPIGSIAISAVPNLLNISLISGNSRFKISSDFFCKSKHTSNPALPALGAFFANAQGPGVDAERPQLL
jgi:hypothetical protein